MYAFFRYFFATFTENANRDETNPSVRGESCVGRRLGAGSAARSIGPRRRPGRQCAVRSPAPHGAPSARAGFRSRLFGRRVRALAGGGAPRDGRSDAPSGCRRPSRAPAAGGGGARRLPDREVGGVSDRRMRRALPGAGARRRVGGVAPAGRALHSGLGADEGAAGGGAAARPGTRCAGTRRARRHGPPVRAGGADRRGGRQSVRGRNVRSRKPGLRSPGV